ncbi:hypothetical protein LSTR_LSTR014738 [Laodelphax striatellus]|uniref:Uncharacterized protein n=1 Tax=Laodelphax striatellus TaxID=195883 RepID=A0A482WW56_LAOST|nr:hypothetical protein LSTR_LSTR014738 [Laodelphax striatellus]
MKSGQFVVYLLLMILVVPCSCGRHRRHHRTETKEEEEKPLNKFRPNIYYTAPPLLMPGFEAADGPALYTPSKYPGFQAYIRRYPQIFMEALDKPNLPQYFSRAMELDQNVRTIVMTTPDGFPDYVSALLDVYSDIEEGIRTKKDQDRSSSDTSGSSGSRSRSRSVSEN